MGKAKQTNIKKTHNNEHSPDWFDCITYQLFTTVFLALSLEYSLRKVYRSRSLVVLWAVASILEV